MYFDLNEEERHLKRVAREFLAEQWRNDDVRRLLDDPSAEPPPELWNTIIQLGWVSLPFPEELGGAGLGLVTLSVLAEEVGRALLPGPFLSTVLAGMVVDRHGSEGLRRALIPAVAAGQCRLTVAINEPGGGYGPESVALPAERDGDSFRLKGRKILVPDAAGADKLLVAARVSGERGDEAGLALFVIPTDAPGVTVNPMARFDANKVAEVLLGDVRVNAADAIGQPGTAGPALSDFLNLSAAILAAEMVGGAQRILEITSEYAKNRIQFGRPIGSFQAVSHPLANMLVNVEVGRALLHGACLALDEGRQDGPALASAAKAWISDAYLQAAEAAIQLHGGIGYTWEHDAHLYLRRARALAVTLGDADYHRDRIAALLEAGLKPPVTVAAPDVQERLQRGFPCRQSPLVNIPELRLDIRARPGLTF